MNNLAADLRRSTPRPFLGRIEEAQGLLVRAKAPNAAIGAFCSLRTPSAGGSPLDGASGPGANGRREDKLAQIVGLSDGAALLAVLGDLDGLTDTTLVAPRASGLFAPVGDGLLGRVIDGLGAPLDAGRRGPLPSGLGRRDVAQPAPAPFDRPPIEKALSLGVPAIDGFMTIGEGQRVGLFGEAGLGKSRLLGDIIRNSEADVCVLALVGERGREVAEFVDDVLGERGLGRSVVVASTSDRSSIERVKAPFLATTIAEHFRDRGARVLLLMDSLTRLARAQREIGLAAGEPPARRAFPPSVFTLLPSLIERAGRTARGSITAIYTTLVEGEDGVGDPVAEEARSLLDGHVVLSRRLAEAGRFPAIDVLASRSRVMDRVASSEHLEAAAKLRALLAKRREIELLIQVGEYRAGADPEADEALAKADAIEGLIRRGSTEATGPARAPNLKTLADRLTQLAGA